MSKIKNVQILELIVEKDNTSLMFDNPKYFKTNNKVEVIVASDWKLAPFSENLEIGEIIRVKDYFSNPIADYGLFITTQKNDIGKIKAIKYEN